jgi:soluble lytic murein transglycosylase
VEVLAGQILYGAGRLEEAYAKFLHALDNYPEAASTFDGLLILVNDGVPVDELQRGLANFYADNYEPALAALTRYREAYALNDPAVNASAPGDSTALYHLGRTYAALGQDAQAIAAWRELVDTYPGDLYWTDAYFQIAFIQPYPDDVETFEAFVADAPDAPEAPDALFRAARLHERNDDLARAAALWLRIAEEYPASAQAADAAIQSGLVLYRTGSYASAAQRFALAATLGTDTSEHARAWLWQGKAREKLGDQDGAQEAYAKAAAFGPHGYYALRAGQIMAGVAPFSSPARYDFDFDRAAEQSQVDRWLRATFPVAQGVDHPSDLQPGVWQDARFVRAAELWRLGRLQDAHAEYDNLRVGLSGDALASWQLALYFYDLGAYDLGIRAARAVVDLAGYPDTLLAPKLILRLRYPAPFAQRVIEAANEFDVHPFSMYAKMRIESFFWKYAYSVADARGLNQIIPPTADDIARQLALEDFEYDDLFRPAVSIPMGAYYLSYVDGLTDGGPEALLAGYYAGPSNAQVWLDLAEGDPDLFVEVIRLPDAKGYVQTTFEYFEMYRELYGK